MKVIKPTEMTLARLVSSTATEAHSAYSSGTTYAVGNKVTYETGVYESIQAGNLNKQPDISPTWWVRLSSTNKWSMFDKLISSVTTASTSVSVVVNTGFIDSLALININADKVTLTVRDGNGGSIVYQEVRSLSNTLVNWYEYFFSGFNNIKNTTVFRGLPPYLNAHCTILIEGTTTVTLGEVVFGSETTLGITQGGSKASIQDYSRKDTDAFGTVTLIKRAYSKRLEASVWVDNANVNNVHRLLNESRATPLVWLGSDDPLLEEPLVVYGFYKDFGIVIAYPTYSVCSLDVEGLI